jgi:hypothetical protein
VYPSTDQKALVEKIPTGDLFVRCSLLNRLYRTETCPYLPLSQHNIPLNHIIYCWQEDTRVMTAFGSFASPSLPFKGISFQSFSGFTSFFFYHSRHIFPSCATHLLLISPNSQLSLVIYQHLSDSSIFAMTDPPNTLVPFVRHPTPRPLLLQFATSRYYLHLHF